MVTQYIIITKRKGAKKFSGAQPLRKGISKEKARKIARRVISKQFNWRIITTKQFIQLFSKRILKKR